MLTSGAQIKSPKAHNTHIASVWVYCLVAVLEAAANRIAVAVAVAVVATPGPTGKCVIIFMWSTLGGWQIQIHDQKNRAELSNTLTPISHSGPPWRPHPESATTWSSSSAKLPTCDFNFNFSFRFSFSSSFSFSSHSNRNCNFKSPHSATCSLFVLVVLIYSGTDFIYRRCLPPSPSIHLLGSESGPCCVIHPSSGWLNWVPPTPLAFGCLFVRFLIWQIYTHHTLHSSSQMLSLSLLLLLSIGLLPTIYCWGVARLNNKLNQVKNNY